jgi:hypothetical protein
MWDFDFNSLGLNLQHSGRFSPPPVWATSQKHARYGAPAARGNYPTLAKNRRTWGTLNISYFDTWATLVAHISTLLLTVPHICRSQQMWVYPFSFRAADELSRHACDAELFVVAEHFGL